MPVFRLPDLGEGLTEAEIVTWHVKVGDIVEVDQPVVEVETAKAVVEVPVPFAGVISELHCEPGETLSVGSPLVTVSDRDDAQDTTGSGTGVDAAAGFAEPGIVTVGPGAPRDPQNISSGNVLIGYGTGAAPARRSRSRRRLTGRSVTVGSQPVTASDAATASAAKSAGPVLVSSPLVRRLAREAGVDIRRIRGSGQGGMVSRADVEAAISTSQLPSSMAAAQTSAEHATAETTQRIPLRGVRKAIADKFARSRREIPEATIWVDVDATPLLQVRDELNVLGEPKISVLALIARFALDGLARYPELNAIIDSNEILISSAIHLGFAAQTERGLLVPVVPDAHTLTLDALTRELAELTRQARAGTLTPSQLTGGTFTVNNYGIFGVDGSAAIINHPEVAILGIGRIIARPWVVNGLVVPRSVTQLTLAFDHRVCDGGTAGGFLRYVADCVERPVRLLRRA